MLAMLPARLERQDLDLFNLRRLGKQFIGLGEQGFCNFAGEVGAATGFVFEGVEDSILSWSNLDGIPCDGGAFLHGQGLG